MQSTRVGPDRAVGSFEVFVGAILVDLLIWVFFGANFGLFGVFVVFSWRFRGVLEPFFWCFCGVFVVFLWCFRAVS